MPPVTTTYAVKLVNADSSIAGSGTLSFTQPDADGNVTVSFTSSAPNIPSVSGAKGTLTQCGGTASLQVTPTATVLLAVQASVYAVGVAKVTTSGLGGGIAVGQLAPAQYFAGAMIGKVQAGE